MAPRARQRELRGPDFLRGLLHMLMHPAPLEGGDTGAALLEDLVVGHELQEGDRKSTRLNSSHSV